MNARTLLTAVALLAVAGGGLSQNPPGPVVVTPEQAKPVVVKTDLNPAEEGLDQLLDRLELLRAKQAELKKQEDDLVREIRVRIDRQDQRAKRLGIERTPEPSLPAIPPSHVPAVIPAAPGVPTITPTRGAAAVPAVPSLPTKPN